jgi:hypothetical protein
MGLLPNHWASKHFSLLLICFSVVVSWGFSQRFSRKCKFAAVLAELLWVSPDGLGCFRVEVRGLHLEEMNMYEGFLIVRAMHAPSFEIDVAIGRILRRRGGWTKADHIHWAP